MNVFICLKLSWVFIDWVISKMHKFVVFAALFILFSCKSSQTLLKNIDSKWIVTCYNNIDSQIKFKTINQVGIINIPWNNMLIINFKLRNVINEINSSSSWQTIRLNNPQIRSVFLFSFSKIIFKFL